jgi:hypothetical protein
MVRSRSTIYFKNMHLAHRIIGARLPIPLPSHADQADAKLLSVALGMIMSEREDGDRDA